MPVRAITFDFWRTLFHEAREPVERRQIRIDALSGATGVSADAARAALATAEHEFLHHHIHEQRTLGPADAVRIVERELGVALTSEVRATLAEVFGSAILQYPPEPVPNALEAVQSAARIFPVGIVSDAGISPGSSLRKLLERFGFVEHLGVLAFSDEVGVAKPQPRMFETAATGLSVEPTDLLHIGDLEGTDIIGAKRLGARAALFVGDNDRYRDQTTADYVIENWTHFIELLPSIRDASE